MSNQKIKIYTGDPITGLKVFPILNRQLGLPPYKGKKPFRGIFDEMDFSFLERVANPQDADFLVVPHYFFSVKDKKSYLQPFLDFSKRYNKKIIVFAYGDAEVLVSLPNNLLKTPRYIIKKIISAIAITKIHSGPSRPFLFLLIFSICLLHLQDLHCISHVLYVLYQYNLRSQVNLNVAE